MANHAVLQALAREASILRELAREHARAGRLSASLGTLCVARDMDRMARYLADPRDRSERLETYWSADESA